MWRGGEVLSVWSKGEGKLMSSVQKSVEGVPELCIWS